MTAGGGRKLKVALDTLGCKANRWDSDRLAAELGALGKAGSDVELVPFTDRADVYIVNTCTVTARTDRQSRNLLSRARRRDGLALVVATGCLADDRGEELLARGLADVTTDNRGKSRIPELLARFAGGGRFPSRLSAEDDPFGESRAAHPRGRTRAFLKVQEGCDASCAYCLIPRVRGRSRSLPPGEAVRRVRELAGAGYREVVLTGIHLGAYGADLSEKSSLSSLVEALLEDGAAGRLRLSSVEPEEVDERLIELLAGENRLCPHLHAPLQSGDDDVLRRMNRRYLADDYRRLVEKLTGAAPGIALGTDVMAGFPGETEEAHGRTLDLVGSLPLAYFHVFPYSDRPGTASASMADKPPPDVVKRRAAELREAGEARRSAYRRSLVGGEAEVLFEKPAGRLWRGYSERYVSVSAPQPKGPPLGGRISRVELTGLEKNGGGLTGVVAVEEEKP